MVVILVIAFETCTHGLLTKSRRNWRIVVDRKMYKKRKMKQKKNKKGKIVDCMWGLVQITVILAETNPSIITKNDNLSIYQFISLSKLRLRKSKGGSPLIANFLYFLLSF